MAKLINIMGLGGTSEIGASATLARLIDDTGVARNILIDSGIRMHMKRIDGELVHSSEGHSDPDCAIDAFLITHAHSDHTGYLPIMKDKNPKSPVYMTRPTFYIAGRLWLSASFLMGNQKIDVSHDYEYKFSNGAALIIKEDKKNIIDKPGWKNIFPGVDAYFGPNGHIRGSAFIVLKVGETIVMFSGDVSIYDSPTVKGMVLPEEFKGRLDAIFVESTYGDRTTVDRREEEIRLVELTKKTLAKGGSCLFPAFGVDRCQAVAKALVLGGVTPVYIDGLGRDIAEIYSDSEKGFWSELDTDSGIDLNDESKIRFIFNSEERKSLIYSRQPFVVVTPAGMLIDGSCAAQYATRCGFLKKPENMLGLTGFQAEYTEGRDLEIAIERGRPLTLGGKAIHITAQVPPRFQLSSHADGMQLADLIKGLAPKSVFINHGQEDGRSGLENSLRLVGFEGRIEKPANGQVIEF